MDKETKKKYERGLEELLLKNPDKWLELKRNGKISDDSIDLKTFLFLTSLGEQ
ncbi:MAG: hypothetical protein V1825_00280 [Candidatus Falkowbacteria bacterium]|nr:hypothetical protein [Candidatus Parcubacteria bacterium]